MLNSLAADVLRAGDTVTYSKGNEAIRHLGMDGNRNDDEQGIR